MASATPSTQQPPRADACFYTFSNTNEPRLSERPTDVRDSSFQFRDIKAMPDGDATHTSYRKFKGRIRTWPGMLLVLVLVAGATVGIVYYAKQSRDASLARQIEALKAEAARKSIRDGTVNPTTTNLDGKSVDELLEIARGPKEYPPTKCQLPNYESRDGQIWAVAANGTAIPISMKGINWSGLETEDQAPEGLWDSDESGTTITNLVDLLAKHKFNSVRLPVTVWNILDNSPLPKAVINRNTNRALDLTNHMSLIQTVTKALAFRGISVMFSMHRLKYNENGGLWYSPTTTVEQFMTSIDKLTAALCSNDYWNVLGIDLKNEPADATWGTGGPDDFKLGAEAIAARMLKGCPKWLAFVEGVYKGGPHSVTVDGKKFSYGDWYGGALQNAKTAPIQLQAPHKVVYAPHYYTPAVYPQAYFYDNVVVAPDGSYAQYDEVSDTALQARVDATMHDMFGFLLDGTKGPAVVLGEFGGLYTKDAHAGKTTQRCTIATMKSMLKNGYAGGYLWTINPNSRYDFNPASKKIEVKEGLMNDDWRSVNEPFLKALEVLDTLPNLQPMPCFPVKQV
ncbi:Aste57867_12829 [Aphanomyces stellatus]|uniref:Aste57867_12829 protein n=1 Tax=Aphanomyces stellatus TaxID=120398 RepID=A0A485KWK2_9STRA|nr:hypothetical protein As57867_012781 [Aphanomyces stellatus]VFT89676.1 Aste57867_12829 [Aphanomyces stellatus]